MTSGPARPAAPVHRLVRRFPTTLLVFNEKRFLAPFTRPGLRTGQTQSATSTRWLHHRSPQPLAPLGTDEVHDDHYDARNYKQQGTQTSPKRLGASCSRTARRRVKARRDIGEDASEDEEQTPLPQGHVLQSLHWCNGFLAHRILRRLMACCTLCEASIPAER